MAHSIMQQEPKLIFTDEIFKGIFNSRIQWVQDTIMAWILTFS